MSSTFQYRPRFKDIRVKPPVEPAPADVKLAEPAERTCDRQGCNQTAQTRAPKSRDMLSDHYWFCQAHAAEYNKAWNFFAGMSEGEIAARVADEQTTGGRPTWSFKAGARNKEAAAARGVFRDPMGIFADAQVRDGQDRAAFDRRLGKLERGALIDLDLDMSADSAAIRLRYIELVKRCHPDSNGGDRSAENKLQRVIKAYKTLQKAKLV